MIESLKVAQKTLSKDKSVYQNFVDYQTCLMEEGFLQLKGEKKYNIMFIGDQNPYQLCEPKLVSFVLNNFQSVKFLHILRHPFPVISSSMKFGDGKGGYICKGMSPSDILKKWVKHEKDVQLLK